MDLSGIKEKINGVFEKIKGIPKKSVSFFDKIRKPNFFSGIISRFKSILDRSGPDKKKPLMVGFGGLAVLVLVLVITIGVINSKKRRMISHEAVSEGLVIAAEELFIPSEPDFVPEYIFEREKRRFWSLEDIRQYWKIPDTSDRWREEIKSAVDKLMEGIP
jgi:hypothetical protein